MAKRYLTAVDKSYYKGLSHSSKQTLKFQVKFILSRQLLWFDRLQGGIFSDMQVKEAQQDPWLEQKLAVRIWDDLAKDPSMKVKPLSFYENMAIKSLHSSSVEKGSRLC